MTEVRNPGLHEAERLKEVWMACFNDDASYIDLFFDTLFKPDEALVAVEDGHIASMVFLLPYCLEIQNSGRTLKAAYVYALGTDPGHRNKGYASRLVEEAASKMKQTGADLMLVVPANQGMFRFFSRLGYEEAFYYKALEIKRIEIRGKAPDTDKAPRDIFKIHPASAEEYLAARSRLLAGKPYVIHGRRFIEFQKKLSQKCGADIYILDLNGASGCAAAHVSKDNTVFVAELLVNDEYLQAGLKLISEALPADAYRIRMPSFAADTKTGRPICYGMLKWLGDPGDYRLLVKDIIDRKSGYLAFGFD